MKECLNFLKKPTWYEIIKQGLEQSIHVLLNFFLAGMKFIYRLMIILKAELFFRHILSIWQGVT